MFCLDEEEYGFNISLHDPYDLNVSISRPEMNMIPEVTQNTHDDLEIIFLIEGSDSFDERGSTDGKGIYYFVIIIS